MVAEAEQNPSIAGGAQQETPLILQPGQQETATQAVTVTAAPTDAVTGANPETSDATLPSSILAAPAQQDKLTLPSAISNIPALTSLPAKAGDTPANGPAATSVARPSNKPDKAQASSVSVAGTPHAFEAAPALLQAPVPVEEKTNAQSSGKQAADAKSSAVALDAASAAQQKFNVPAGPADATNVAHGQPKESAAPSAPSTDPLLAANDAAGAAAANAQSASATPSAAQLQALALDLPLTPAAPSTSQASSLAATANGASGSSSLQATKSPGKPASGEMQSKDSGLAPTSAAARGTSSDPISTTGDDSAHSSPKGTPNSQGDPAPSIIAAKSVGLAPSPASSAHAVSHDATPSPSGTAGPAGNTRPGDQRADAAAAQDESAAPASGINTARVIQNMNESEMRVGMHSTEFGDISIRTSVSQQQMFAQISVDHGDLGQAISAHVSTMQTRLEHEYGLHASIEVHQSGSSFSSDAGQSSPRDPRAFSTATGSANMAASGEIDNTLSPALPAIAGDGYRLDVRA